MSADYVFADAASEEEGRHLEIFAIGNAPNKGVFVNDAVNPLAYAFINLQNCLGEIVPQIPDTTSYIYWKYLDAQRCNPKLADLDMSRGFICCEGYPCGILEASATITLTVSESLPFFYSDAVIEEMVKEGDTEELDWLREEEVAKNTLHAIEIYQDGNDVARGVFRLNEYPSYVCCPGWIRFVYTHTYNRRSRRVELARFGKVLGEAVLNLD